ncbi:hypothetical protein NL676_020891 [Syzygium grande]|nr:hypothetical protein NL676_020891 [Syzygium grande]
MRAEQKERVGTDESGMRMSSRIRGGEEYLRQKAVLSGHGMEPSGFPSLHLSKTRSENALLRQRSHRNRGKARTFTGIGRPSLDWSSQLGAEPRSCTK